MVQPKAAAGQEAVTYRSTLSGYRAQGINLTDTFDYYVQPALVTSPPDAAGSGFASGAWGAYTVAANDVLYAPGWTTIAFPNPRPATPAFTLAGDNLSIIKVGDDRAEIHANVFAGVAQVTFPVGTVLAIFIDGVEAGRAQAVQAEAQLRVTYIGPVVNNQAISVRFFNPTAGNLGIRAIVGTSSGSGAYSGGDTGTPVLLAMSESTFMPTTLLSNGTGAAGVGPMFFRFGIQMSFGADWGIWLQVGTGAGFKQVAYKTIPTGVYDTIIIPAFDSVPATRILISVFGHNTFSSTYAQWTYIRGKSPAVYLTPANQKIHRARKDGIWRPVTQMWGKRGGFWREQTDARVKPRRPYNLAASNSGGSLVVTWDFEDNPVSGPLCDSFDVNVYSGHTGSSGALARSVTIPGPAVGGGPPYSSGAMAGLGASAVDIIVTSKIGLSTFGRKDSEVLSFN